MTYKWLWDFAFLAEPLNPQQGCANAAKVVQMQHVELTTDLFLYRTA